MIARMGEQFPCCRHLHPCEVILLCGAFPGRPIQGDMRLALAAAGQMASPMHSVWIFGHIQRHLQVFFDHAPVVDACELLAEWQREVLLARDKLWPAIPSNKLVLTRSVPLPNPPRISFSVGMPNVTGFIDVVASPGVTVAELINAEAALDGTGCLSYFVTSLDLNGRMQPIERTQVLQAGDFVCVSMTPPVEEASVTASPQHPSLFDDDQFMVHEKNQVSEAVELPLDLGRAGEETPNPPCVEVVPAVAEAVVEAEFDFTMWQDPLSKLSRTGLLQVLCPQVLTIGAFNGLRQQTISGVLRKLVLKNQEGSLGDDEMLLHLHELARIAPSDQQVVVWDPLVLSALAKLRQGHVVFQWASTLAHRCTIITAVVVGSHWVPVIWRKVDEQLLGFSSFVPAEFRDVIQELHAYVCRICECTVTPVTFAPHPPTARFCGTAALRFVSHLLTGESLQISDGELALQYGRDSELFRSKCVQKVPRPWIWGLGHPEGQAQLSALLRQHGVEASDIGSRCERIFTHLGKDEVVKALKSSNPWKNLKWLANQHVPPYQIIQPSELQQAIVARSQSGAPIGNRAMKAKGKGKGKKGVSGDVNPDSLRLETGVFVGNDAALSQLKVSQLGPVSSGVVLATFDQALPYLTSGKHVSMGSLGIVVRRLPF